MIGLNLAHYRIDGELGRGGMGIVYKATDTKLNRTVALKVLPASALASEDDRARFFREAQAAAQLHHPNIATVFQIDEAIPVDDSGAEVQASDGPRPFIAMEFVEGDTVADLIKKAPFPLAQAVSIAGQVAEALKEAHGKDVVHRDIKSANVMLTPDGIAKVLDFGLAKTNQSTMLTRMGSTLGTVAYMSPEQARGQEVDGRTDLYALGTMLYEMVAGRLPFAGDYEQAVLYSILNEPPEPLTALRTGVPMDMERVVSKLLSKEAEYRYQTAAGLLADLKSLDLTGSGHSRRSMAAMPGVVVPPTQRGVLPIWGWAAIAAALLIGAAASWIAKPAPVREVTHLTIDLPSAARPLRASWSPDGRELYYVATDTTGAQLATEIRRYEMSDGTSAPVEGTEEARSVEVSPDGRWLYLYRRGRVERMLTTGGRPTAIAGSETRFNQFGVGSEGEVYFTTTDFKGAVASLNGDVTVVVDRDSLGNSFWEPVTGPNGDHLYWLASTAPGVTAGSYGRTNRDGPVDYVLPQHVVLALSSNGYAIVKSNDPDDPAAVVPFDARTSSFLSDPVPVDGMDRLALSASGHLIYEGGAVQSTTSEYVFEIQTDETERLLGTIPGMSEDFAAANRQRALVIETRVNDSGRVEERDLFLFDLQTNTQTRLTRDGDNYDADWSPDDEWIYFTRRIDPDLQFVARRRADGTGAIEPVIADSFRNGNATVSPDGSLIVYTSQRPVTDWDLYGYRVESGESFLIADAPVAESDAHFSPDGRHIVYRSGGSYNGAVLVTPVDGEGEIEVAPRGGFPVWSADGGHIYYLAGRQTIRRISVSSDPVFRRTGTEEDVFVISGGHLHFDLLNDETVITSHRVNEVQQAHNPLRLILNFDVLMEQLAPR